MSNFVEQMENEYREKIRGLHFFDANCCLGRVNNRGPVFMNSVDDLIGHMDRCGIEKAVVCHALARYSHPLFGNEKLLREIAGNDRLTGCFILLPEGTRELNPPDEYIDYMIQKKVYFAKIFPDSQRFSVDEWSASSLFGSLEQRRVPLFIRSREITWSDLYGILTRYPALPIIVEQGDAETYRDLRYLYPLMEKCENLYLEVHNSHLYLQVDDIVRRFGAKRLIFSTYYPVDDSQTSMMLITHGSFDMKDKEMIAHGNLENLIAGVRR
jgi:hypothetical protein